MRRALLLVPLLLTLMLASPAVAAPWTWPLGDHTIERPFDPPSSEYGAGHR